MDIVLNAGIIC